MAVYELRTYDIHPGKMAAINARFQQHTLRFFQKHGIEVVGFWQREIGDAGQLIYVCRFDSEQQLQERWASFRADPDWLRVREESEREGPLVRQVSSVVMYPTPYSPLQ
jgi:hypothetical protein